jgi:hypothetical protein
MPKLNFVDIDLANQIVDVITIHHAWPAVREYLIEKIIDEMSVDIMQKLTGTRDDYSQAEKFLTEYYDSIDRHLTLILDAFQIFGTTQTCYYLDLIVSKDDDEIQHDFESPEVTE